MMVEISMLIYFHKVSFEFIPCINFPHLDTQKGSLKVKESKESNNYHN